MSNPKHFLIFSPDLSGHRYLYCNRICEYLQSRDVEVTIAHLGRADGVSGLGKIQFKPIHDDRITAMLQQPGRKVWDLQVSENGTVPGSISQLNHGLNSGEFTDVIHLDADLYRLPLAFCPLHSQGVRHHLLYIMTEFIDWEKRISPFQELWECVRILPQRKRLGSWLRNRIEMAVTSPRLAGFLIRRAARRPEIHSVLTTDERLQNLPLDKTYFLPEVGSIQWDSHTEEREAFSERVIKKVEEFCQSQPGKVPLFLFGDLERRKGYDLLLQLAVREPETLCIRIGRTKPLFRTTWSNIQNKEILLQQDRLLEIDSYVNGGEVFQSIMPLQKVAIFAYHRFYRTSALFVDSLLAGLPVVAPKTGLMGYRVEKYGLGATFTEGDIDSLQAAWQQCCKNQAELRSNVNTYRKRLSKEAIYQTWDSSLLGNRG